MWIVSIQSQVRQSSTVINIYSETSACSCTIFLEQTTAVADISETKCPPFFTDADMSEQNSLYSDEGSDDNELSSGDEWLENYNAEVDHGSPDNTPVVSDQMKRPMTRTMQLPKMQNLFGEKHTKNLT
ncbi:Hypothetical predicted protein [Mytilus galloprovincialis]|uniref:Uncharacterized protein n=1 Tax=Mytilus galloprovincialis TaxID=29158 RepID=A0A8B6GZE6_MYTGA|nr:Hypothetical predicted protein [Mytilus galloprovincialis]